MYICKIWGFVDRLLQNMKKINCCKTRHQSSVLQSFEIIIIQETKPVSPSCLVASDLEEVCESRGRGGKGLEMEAGVQACAPCPGHGLLNS